MATNHTGLAASDDMDVAEDIADALRNSMSAIDLRRVTDPNDAANLPKQPWHGTPHLFIETDATDADQRREYVIALYRI